MTSPEKPAEFRPADNYDTNPYYDENFDHSVTNPFKQIDGRLDALEATVDTEDTGLSDRVEALETTVDTASTGLSDRVEALETTVDTAETGLVARVAAIEADLFTAVTGLNDRVTALEQAAANSGGGEE